MGFSKAMSNKWIRVDKSTADGPRVFRVVSPCGQAGEWIGGLLALMAPHAHHHCRWTVWRMRYSGNSSWSGVDRLRSWVRRKGVSLRRGNS